MLLRLLGMALLGVVVVSPFSACRQASVLMAERERKLQEFQHDIQAAPCAKAFIHFTTSGRKDVELPVPNDQLVQLKEILSHLRPVAPAMGEKDMSHAYWLAHAIISFSDAQGKVGPFSWPWVSVINPKSIMPESKARELDPDREKSTYEPGWYLPDAQFAQFESLPIVKQVVKLVDAS